MEVSLEMFQKLEQTLEVIKEAILPSDKLELEGYLSSKKVMEILDISRPSFDRLCREVPIHKVRGKIYIHRSVLEELMEDGKRY